MRRRFHDFRVCSCSPVEGMTFMDAPTLKALVYREIHPIRCASTCGRKAQKALYLGDLLVEAHHPMWAWDIWEWTIGEIHDKDYDDWIGVWFNPKYVSYNDVISNGICEILGKRIDDVRHREGWGEAEGRVSWEYWAGDGWYGSLEQEWYDNDWEYWREYFINLREEALAEQKTERIFREGQGDLPPQAQDFFYYWEDFDPLEQNLYFKVDDWDDCP